jgi:hypothetical protein
MLSDYIQINYNSSVVPATSLDLPRNLNTYYSRRSPITRFITRFVLPFFETFHPFINCPPDDTDIAILNCHCSVNFTTFHTLWPQTSHYRALFFFGAFYQWSSHVNCATVKRQWKQRRFKRGEGSCSMYLPYFTVLPTSALKWTKILFNFLLPFIN